MILFYDLIFPPGDYVRPLQLWSMPQMNAAQGTDGFIVGGYGCTCTPRLTNVNAVPLCPLCAISGQWPVQDAIMCRQADEQKVLGARPPRLGAHLPSGAAARDRPAPLSSGIFLG
jgi:hypothetical protein